MQNCVLVLLNRCWQCLNLTHKCFKRRQCCRRAANQGTLYLSREVCVALFLPLIPSLFIPSYCNGEFFNKNISPHAEVRDVSSSLMFGGTVYKKNTAMHLNCLLRSELLAVSPCYQAGNRQFQQQKTKAKINISKTKGWGQRFKTPYYSSPRQGGDNTKEPLVLLYKF